MSRLRRGWLRRRRSRSGCRSWCRFGGGGRRCSCGLRGRQGGGCRWRRGSRGLCGGLARSDGGRGGYNGGGHGRGRCRDLGRGRRCRNRGDVRRRCRSGFGGRCCSGRRCLGPDRASSRCAFRIDRWRRVGTSRGGLPDGGLGCRRGCRRGLRGLRRRCARGRWRRCRRNRRRFGVDRVLLGCGLRGIGRLGVEVDRDGLRHGRLGGQRSGKDRDDDRRRLRLGRRAGVLRLGGLLLCRGGQGSPRDQRSGRCECREKEKKGPGCETAHREELLESSPRSLREDHAWASWRKDVLQGLGAELAAGRG